MSSFCQWYFKVLCAQRSEGEGYIHSKRQYAAVRGSAHRGHLWQGLPYQTWVCSFHLCFLSLWPQSKIPLLAWNSSKPNCVFPYIFFKNYILHHVCALNECLPCYQLTQFSSTLFFPIQLCIFMDYLFLSRRKTLAGRDRPKADAWSSKSGASRNKKLLRKLI